jgi:sugar (pentulose or hexulose) kinase
MDMLPGYTAPKVLWLKRHEPENFAKLATVLLPHDYLNHYLTGNKYMEYGDASGTALLDVRKREWSATCLDFIDPGLIDKMPAAALLAAALRPAPPRAHRRALGPARGHRSSAPAAATT